MEAPAADFSRGLTTLRVPMALFAKNRARLIAKFAEDGQPIEPHSVILMEGAKQTTRFDTDHEPLLRQESFFHWMFGVTEGDCFGMVDVSTGKSTLFIPRLPESYAVWMGAIQPPEFFKEKYGVNEVKFVEEIAETLKANNVDVLYVIKGTNTDSGSEFVPPNFKGISDFQVNSTRLHPHIVECRVIKTPEEIEVLRYAAKVSSDAHIHVMQSIRPGMMEYQLESLFLHHSYYHGGCRIAGYTCICGTGNNSSILHYGHAGAPNDRQIGQNEMCLLDMGAEYYCYGADITCSYPSSGTFSPNQKFIYETVLRAQQAVFAAMKPGVKWSDMHLLAYRVICECLKEGGILIGDVEEMMQNHIGAVFMPHGLGHLLGIDTHDPGGYPNGTSRSDQPGLRSLRLGRELQEGMFVTVEPGVYFINAVLDPALRDENKNKFINHKRLEEFRGFGGVRLEDDVLVTATGIDNFTRCPRTVEEVEACMAGRPWQKK